MLNMVDITNFTTNALDYIQNNLASAVIILLVGIIISYFLGRILRVILKEIELDNITYSAFGLKLKLEKKISKLVTYILYIVTVIIALTKLLIGYYILIGLGILIGLIIVISLVLRIYDFIPDYICGIIIKKKTNIKLNSTFSFKNISGKVKKITLMNVILDVDGDFIYIPNRTIKRYLKEIIIKN